MSSNNKRFGFVFYSEGSQLIKTETIKRNDPCPCGSGLKFKKCHISNNLKSHIKVK